MSGALSMRGRSGGWRGAVAGRNGCWRGLVERSPAKAFRCCPLPFPPLPCLTACPAPPCLAFSAEEEEFMRSGHWFGARHGVKRRLHLYKLDPKAAEQFCTKHAYNTKKFVPGGDRRVQSLPMQQQHDARREGGRQASRQVRRAT